MVDRSKTMREQIVDALKDGFGPEAIDKTENQEVDDETHTLVYVKSYSEPIRVHPMDVELPEEFRSVAGAIALDVSALIAMNREEER